MPPARITSYNVCYTKLLRLVLGTIGATFILIGIAFLYVMTGTLNIADLAHRIPQVRDTRTVHMAFSFLIIGIAIKAAVV